MRTAKILTAALAAAISVSAAPAGKVIFTKPLLEWPPEFANAQVWLDARFTRRFVLEASPDVQAPPEAEAPPEQLWPNREPDSEEWHCLVPLKDAEPPPVVEAPKPNHCQTPSLEPDHLLHLL
jgi:hypothetical protein